MLMTSSTFVACWTGRLVAHESPCLKHNRPSELRNGLRELLAGCGHRTQQERADEVSAAMIDFLRTLVAEQPDLTLEEIVTAIRAQDRGSLLQRPAPRDGLRRPVLLETRYRARVIDNLHRRAEAFGFVLQPTVPVAVS